MSKKALLTNKVVAWRNYLRVQILTDKKGNSIQPRKAENACLQVSFFFFFEIMHTCEATACMPSGISLCFLQVTFVIRFAMYVCAISGGNFESPEIALSPCSIVMQYKFKNSSVLFQAIIVFSVMLAFQTVNNDDKCVQSLHDSNL